LDAVRASTLSSPQRPSPLLRPGDDGVWAESVFGPLRDVDLRRRVERIRRGNPSLTRSF
jgi:hypothetical protein